MICKCGHDISLHIQGVQSNMSPCGGLVSGENGYFAQCSCQKYEPNELTIADINAELHKIAILLYELLGKMERSQTSKKKEPRRCWVVMDSVVADNEGDWYQAYRSRKDAERNASERDSVVEMVEKEREG